MSSEFITSGSDRVSAEVLFQWLSLGSVHLPNMLPAI